MPQYLFYFCVPCQLMYRVTQLLYEKYFPKHEQAHEDIKNRCAQLFIFRQTLLRKLFLMSGWFLRMKRLQTIKQQQLDDLSTLKKEREDIKSKTESLIEKLNEIKTRQEHLSNR